MATMTEVAKRSGVSLATVSYVLGEKGHLVRAETRDKVIAAAKALNYRPNAAAKAMQSGRFGTLGLLLGGDYRQCGLQNEMLGGIHYVLAEKDLQLIVSRMTHADPNGTQNLVPQRIMSELMVDGFLINYTYGFPDEAQALVDGLSWPAVWMNVKRSHNCVYPDDHQGGALAVEHLREHGHSRIAYLQFHCNQGKGDHYSRWDRRQGYVSAMKGAGLEAVVLERERGFWGQAALSFLKEYLSRPDRATALVSYTLEEVELAHHVAVMMGMEVPRDLSLVTFAPHPGFSLGVACSSIIVPDFEVGAEAARQLIETIDSKGRARRRAAKAIPMTLSEKDSVCAPRSRT